MAEQDTVTPLNAGGNALDSEHPWLGLDSFSEHSSAFFYGRDQEVAELARRVQRKLLTVLFGQSGLGKTSILRAGIVPRLRPQGYCPVYVRIDYAADAPAPAAQIKQAILRATAELGDWTRPGSAEAHESLWEFLHHRADVLLDHQGRPLIPLLIFDQFEEIFTLAQADDAGRRRAAEFITELADLVENRPPRALEAELETDELLTEEFDFSRSDYRILIALREDYLAHLEGFKGSMPSITQNRMRLARMKGAQALAAVTLPGGALVSQEVAAAIVRFTAGGADLAHAEVEPSLLSLICRELNTARLAQGRAEISTDLLAGSHASILSQFYARALADQPPGVARLIEDELLTDGGFRENLAEERVRNGFAAAGAAPEALAVLVNRRLLRIEERLDVRRVELTHDVLCEVVRAARASRKERELREQADRQLALQAERERATGKSLRRARQVAAVCTVLTIGAIGSAAFGYVQLRAAQETRATAERSRVEAEKLMDYLLDDFYEELRPIGKTKLQAELAGRTAAYYRDLPPAMRTPDTELHRAFTLQHLATIERAQGRHDDAIVTVNAALAVLEPRVAAGDTAEAVRLRLAAALTEHARNIFRWGERLQANRELARAVALAQPYAKLPQASPQARRIYLTALMQYGYTRMRNGDYAGANQSLRYVRAMLTDDKLSAHPSEAVMYADAGSWLVEVMYTTGHNQEAAALTQESLQIIEQILQNHPGHLDAIRLRERINSINGQGLTDLRKASAALAVINTALHDTEYVARIDPDDGANRDNQAINLGYQARAFFALGQPQAGQQAAQQLLALYQKIEPNPYQSNNLVRFLEHLARNQAELNQLPQLQQTIALQRHYAARAGEAQDNRTYFALDQQRRELQLNLLSGAQPVSAAAIAALIAQTRQLVAAQQKKTAAGPIGLRIALAQLLSVDADAALERDDPERAAASNQEVMEIIGADFPDISDDNWISVYLQRSLALSGVGRHSEALSFARKALRFQRAQIAKGADDQYLRVELAQSLYAAALAQPKAGLPELNEARATLSALPEVMRQYRSVKLCRKRIKALQRERSQ